MDSYYVDLNAAIVMRAMREAGFYADFPEYNEDIVKEKFHRHFNGNDNVNFLDDRLDENKMNYLETSLLVFIEKLTGGSRSASDRKFSFDSFFRLARFSSDMEYIIINNKRIYEKENNGIEYVPRKYTDDIDVVKLSYFIKNLTLFPSNDYIEMFSKVGLFNRYKLQENAYYYENDDAVSTWRDFQVTCTRWISEQITLGYSGYSRKKPNFSFRKTWKSLQSANMLLWCAFILGVDRSLIERADEESRTAGGGGYKAVRDVIDFDVVLDCVSNGRCFAPHQSLGLDCFR